MLIKTILYTQQRRRDINNGLFAGSTALGDQGLEPTDFRFDVTAQLTETQHPERVADLLEQIELRHEFRWFFHAGANVNVEHVFDTRKIFLDRRGNRLHELYTWRGQTFPGVLDLLIARAAVQRD